MVLRPALVLSLIISVVLSSACGFLSPRDPGIGKAIKWNRLTAWKDDDHLHSWQAMLSQCPRMARRDNAWVALCDAAIRLENPDAPAVRNFFEQHFKPHRIYGRRGKVDGLITGYYEPILNGSLERTDKFRYPIYGTPPDMLMVDLAELYPQLKGMRLRGRIVGNRVVPYHSRETIDGKSNPLAGQEILWVDDPYGSFFLQIQGSGKVRVQDGSLLGVNYANQNGHPYVAIGKKLVEINALQLEEVSLFTIKAWLRANPERADEILNANPSYVFFELREQSDEGPRGSLNVPLTASRSLAVDRRVIPLGTPVWLETTLPDGSEYQRLMFAQDTGGAINGPVRADVFFGTGADAEKLAGEMKQSGRLYALLPKEP
ncbi:hypothetical protein AB833_19060 [Chromatiales bacterium (ex Bugula neritina AB1)]|nr:hypothetical protein AB833_19060 [Chromatiales bacterium (ex Bugula neritina AB1)]